jgi:protein-S-isoprenylcysteine O-methyltransferase Ste14
LEFWAEVIIFGQKRLQYRLTFLLGLIMVIGGQYFRSLAMWQCGESFNHIIAHTKPEHHRLQTEGLYRYLRHPSYFGWFYWSIGMQLVLGNFWCFCAYFYVSWKFFHDRIPYEEHFLWQFYGRDYQEYVQRSYIGIPFIGSKIPCPTPISPKVAAIPSTIVNASSREQRQEESDVTSEHVSILEEDDEDYESAKITDPQDATTEVDSTHTIPNNNSNAAVDEIPMMRDSSRSDSTDKKND